MGIEETRRIIIKTILRDLKAGHFLAQSTPQKLASLCGHPLSDILSGTGVYVEDIPGLIEDLKREWQ